MVIGVFDRPIPDVRARPALDQLAFTVFRAGRAARVMERSGHQIVPCRVKPPSFLISERGE